MNINETKQLLDSISAIDNRSVGVDTLEAWHAILGAIPFDIAKEALKLAQQDASVKYLEPRHIYGWAKEAAFRLDKKKPHTEEVIKGDPCPTCHHGKCITWCDDCCARLSAYHKTHEQIQLQVCGCHEFAMRELVA